MIPIHPKFENGPFEPREIPLGFAAFCASAGRRVGSWLREAHENPLQFSQRLGIFQQSLEGCGISGLGCDVESRLVRGF